MPSSRLAALSLIPTLVSACGGDARFAASFASGFVPASHTVSVLGVYKDGQMSSDAWNAIGPRISAAFGARTCEAGYGSALLAADAPLTSAIDDYAQANGPTDDLLGQIAPAAKGDLIVVITFAGRLPRAAPDVGGASAVDTPVTSGARGAMGGRGSPGGGRGAAPRRTPVDTNVLDVSASLYSVAQARSVGLVSMEYSGSSIQDAVTRFEARLAREVPAATCSGWKWADAKVDPARIRERMDP